MEGWVNSSWSGGGDCKSTVFVRFNNSWSGGTGQQLLVQGTGVNSSWSGVRVGQQSLVQSGMTPTPPPTPGFTRTSYVVGTELLRGIIYQNEPYQ